MPAIISLPTTCGNPQKFSLRSLPTLSKKYPLHLLKVINVLKKLPGVGTRSAERFAFDLLSWPSEQLVELGTTLSEIPAAIHSCEQCGCLIDSEQCSYCKAEERDTTTLCVLSSPKNVFAIEDTGEFRGLYHILSGTMNPLEGRGPEVLRLSALEQRIGQLGVQEVILALDSTLDGDATALYLKKQLERPDLKVSRIAFGLPMGSSLEYVDEGTLASALSGRRNF